MTTNFEKMCRRNGGYSLPWLISLQGDEETLYYINDTADRTYNGHTYKASTFSYHPEASEAGLTGGGSLEIAAADANEEGSVIAFIESTTSVILTVTGVLLETGTVNEVRTFRHSYGTVRRDGRTAKFTFEKDDRLSMTFPALIFSNYNNRGNA